MLLVLLGLLCIFLACSQQDDDRPKVNVVNLAGMPIDLYWISDGGDEVKLSHAPILNGSSSITSSFDTHRFIVRFAENGKDTTEKKLGRAEAKFTKSAYHEIAYVSSFDSSLGFVAKQLTVALMPVSSVAEMKEWKGGESTHKLPAHVRLLPPRERIAFATTECDAFKDGGELFSRCFMDITSEDYELLMRKKASAAKSRDLMSSRLRNYTCEDETLETTKPLYSKTLHVLDTTHTIDVLLDLPSAKIWTVQNFISDSDCDILKRVSGPLLARAMVADEDGTAIFSEHRKAQQARYIGFESLGFTTADPLFPLYQKVYNVTNQVTQYQLHTDGQEGFMLIQYNKEDQYTPHCDGDCLGLEFNPGGRVASAVMYCEVPTKGGSTTFTKADIFVKPVKGMATFFSYKGPDGMMDETFTEHSGCPVLEGEKWITSVWMRDGVSLERPQSLFDPSGALLQEPGAGLGGLIAAKD